MVAPGRLFDPDRSGRVGAIARPHRRNGRRTDNLLLPAILPCRHAAHRPLPDDSSRSTDPLGMGSRQRDGVACCISRVQRTRTYLINTLRSDLGETGDAQGISAIR